MQEIKNSIKEINKKAWVVQIHENVFPKEVTFFLDSGKFVRLKAIGIEKISSKNRNALQPFSIVDIEFFQSTNQWTGKLKRAKLLKQFIANTKRDVYFFEAIKELIITFSNLSSHCFQLINFLIFNMTYYFLSITNLFYLAMQILKLQQINYEFIFCSLCKNKENLISFSLFEGGVICKKCVKKSDFIFGEKNLHKINLLLTTKVFSEIEHITFSPIVEKAIKTILVRFLEENFGIFLDSFKKV